MKKNAAAVLSGRFPHYLDHLAPLCALKNLPLLIDDPDCDDLCKRYYPDVHSAYFPTPSHLFEELCQYDTIICTGKHVGRHIELFAQMVYQHQIKTLCCPHGESEKEEPIEAKDLVIYYGARMRREVVKKQAKPFMHIGNYRHRYQQLHRTHLPSDYPHIDWSKRCLLFAPSWEDDIDEEIERLASSKPSDWNLFIKRHPLYKKRLPIEEEGVYIFDHDPRIYPLLERCDALYGNHSSIGYDYLTFKRPMFFTPSASGQRLAKAGLIIPKDVPPFTFIDKHLTTSHKAYQHLLYVDSFETH